MTLEGMEKRMINDCLKKNDNNISIVAEKLGITRQTLYNKIRKYSLQNLII
jgi:transcriptional regulator with PAS, ATPase and Fis domain